MSVLGPKDWDQPFLGTDVAHLIVNGTTVDFTLTSLSASLTDQQGVVVETAVGTFVLHHLLAQPSAPLTFGRFEIEVEEKMVAEDIRALLMSIPARARDGSLRLWLDRWIIDVWRGNASRTTFVMSRSTGYGSVPVTFAERSARCFVEATELAHTTGPPASGEFQLTTSADSTSIVLGDAPATMTYVTLRYYPVIRAIAEFSEDRSDTNDGDMTGEFEEYIPARDYGA